MESRDVIALAREQLAGQYVGVSHRLKVSLYINRGRNAKDRHDSSAQRIDAVSYSSPPGQLADALRPGESACAMTLRIVSPWMRIENTTTA